MGVLIGSPDSKQFTLKKSKNTMINKTLFSALFIGSLLFGSQAKADWVMDFGPSGLSSGITSFSFTGEGSKTVDHTNGHSVVFDSVSPFQVQSAVIRYEFPSLYNQLIIGSDATDEVRFEFDFGMTNPESQFVFQGFVERASGGAAESIGALNFTAGDNASGNTTFFTGLTIGDIQADDVTSLEFSILSIGPFLPNGDANTFTFGGPNGLVAAPEPTSAAMIGCALVGLIARRRRRA